MDGVKGLVYNFLRVHAENLGAGLRVNSREPYPEVTLQRLCYV